MTEKRFKLGYVCGDYGLIDNDEWIDLHSMSENSEKNVQICINKLNALAEENEQLKDENKELKEYEELFFKEVFDILLKYQDLFNREMADEVLEELGIELTKWFE